MTPIFFNIVRFYNVILQKSTNIITILITFIVCFGALLYLTIPQLLEINVYYIPKTGCPFEIYSNIPYFAEVQIFNFFLLVFIPIVGFVLNYIIYKLVVYRKNKITARENQTENRNLFRSIAIQSLYPFGCQFPGICLIIYQLVTYKSNYLIDVIIIFIYHFGQAFCILLSLFVIREFRIVIYKDFRIPVLGETTQIFNAKKATTTRTIAINNI
ncbi:Hypothetical protein SRAE_2000478200 [Strongyloides ratti]|uniref:Uncharacterized protein n=1 Tax=Strongyloides ratti TaxID=34506 RepID=A0A090LK31_STRRB|nr:Hypothetical protein SRAE_2000478200 [Strongyloides ratti]CEF70147.1 Hypothetical protein SRAE_2000478200 [Strongyloides ratti]